MKLVLSKGNISTEGRVERALIEGEIKGWIKHPTGVPGRPDFFFPRSRLALFVDGCFWHGCARCNRRLPLSRRAFWMQKIAENKRRDARVKRQLWRGGYRLMRIWEHELKRNKWLIRLNKKLAHRVSQRQCTIAV